MHEMDLIPAAYRAQRARRQRQRRWAVALGLMVLSVLSARLWIERGLAQERAWKAQWQPLQDKARTERSELKNLQSLIALAQAPASAASSATPSIPLDLLPSVLATLPATGVRLFSATLEPSAAAAARLNLQGQAADEATLGHSVALLQGHPQVAQVQLLGVKAEGTPGANGQRFELLLRLSASPAASTASAGERP